MQDNPLRARLRTAAALAALCVGAFIVPAQAERADYKGFYVRIDPDYAGQQNDFAVAMEPEFVDGAAIMLQWKNIEPQRGAFNFALFDKWVMEVLKRDKKISLGLMAGWFTPDWVYEQNNVGRNVFSFNRSPRGAPQCAMLTLPSVWDPGFVAAYTHTVQAIAQNLKSIRHPLHPDRTAFNAVTVMKIGGVNNTTEELRLNTERAGGPCQQDDAVAIWAKAGFKPSRVKRAFAEIADAVAKTFPSAMLSLPIIHAHGLPAIDESGRQLPPGAGVDPTTRAIVDASYARYGARLLLQWDALSQDKPLAYVVDANKQRKIPVGWQLNQWLGVQGATGCSYGGARQACQTQSDFASILKNGVAHGGRYFELWAQSVVPYGEAFRQARPDLR